MVPYKYLHIDTHVIERFTEDILAGQSMTLMGPRACGKRYVLNQIINLIKKKNASIPIVRIEIVGPKGIDTFAETFNLVVDSVEKTAQEIGVTLPEFTTQSFWEPIDALRTICKQRIILFLANVDGMAHHIARNMLQGIQVRTVEGRMVVMLTGESSFRELVHGPESAFVCTNQYVMQGLAPDEFEKAYYNYAKALNIPFDVNSETCNKLWELTGGFIYLLRTLLWISIESEARTGNKLNNSKYMEELGKLIHASDIPHAFGAFLFNHAMHVISREPGCWNDLRALLQGETPKINPIDDSPGPLELAGVAKRNEGNLLFSSELMKTFVAERFDDRYFADLHAMYGRWDKAFALYRTLAEEQLVRPAGNNDRSAIQQLVASFGSHMFACAADGPDKVLRLFTNGCRLVLGFPHVAIWEKDRVWRLVSYERFSEKDTILEQIGKDLPCSCIAVTPGILRLPEYWNPYALACTVSSPHIERWNAFVVGDFKRNVAISRERERLTHNVLQHFVNAYEYAVRVDRLKQRLKIREKHVKIITSIVAALGHSVKDALQALQIAACGLRELGYKRVLFCLVDPKREWIDGVLDNSDDRIFDVAEHTHYRINEPTSDIQPYVIHTKKPVIIEDAQTHPNTCKKVAHQARMGAEAIVPILDPSGEAIGTIHIERSDHGIPTNEEVQDLLEFGHSLAVVIQQSERVNLQETALDKIAEPIVIVDYRKRVRYANESAQQELYIPAGWRTPEKAESLPTV